MRRKAFQRHPHTLSLLGSVRRPCATDLNYYHIANNANTSLGSQRMAPSEYEEQTHSQSRIEVLYLGARVLAHPYFSSFRR